MIPKEMFPREMRAVEIARPGGPEVLKSAVRPVPAAKANEILIKVAAAGVNRPDVLQRSGNYPVPPDASDLPGLEVAGEVVATGSSATTYKPGDKVCALVHGGGYAEYCVAPEVTALPVPKGCSLTEAASLPETFFTVWGNVFDRARLAPAESRLGADQAINYKTQDFAAEIKAATGGKGVNVILDMVGGDYVPKELKSLADDGRLVFIAFLRGHKTELDINEVMRRRLTISGSTLRPRPVEFKGSIARNLREKIWPLIDAGKIKPAVYRTFPLGEAAEAHRLLES